ncbi:hypothetical protein NDU88_006265 [Pleurodeles waltl]|uniref:Uncharacterized protein n=1 Tax=Pleurodeles waltl TaxID=8319 RepID=A0AAV7SP40_PLEWA|nr:hypothetical protein NDU88_006265 [Pleurodeles waltl]
MGKHDAKQPKLNFDHKRSARQGELVQGPQATEERDLAADDQGEDLRTLMLEMRSSLRNIDTKLDNLANQLDSVKTQVATHETSERYDLTVKGLLCLKNKHKKSHQLSVFSEELRGLREGSFTCWNYFDMCTFSKKYQDVFDEMKAFSKGFDSVAATVLIF